MPVNLTIWEVQASPGKGSQIFKNKKIFKRLGCDSDSSAPAIMSMVLDSILEREEERERK
jgi:hypothetical protein